MQCYNITFYNSSRNIILYFKIGLLTQSQRAYVNTIYTNHYTNQKKVRKIIPTTIPTIIYKWQNSAEKSQAHNLKVVGSNPTPATNYIYKINNLDHPQRLRFLGFFCVLSLIRVWLYQPSYQPVVRFIIKTCLEKN